MSSKKKREADRRRRHGENQAHRAERRPKATAPATEDALQLTGWHRVAHFLNPTTFWGGFIWVLVGMIVLIIVNGLAQTGAFHALHF